jgi:putative two-component system response regulator
LTEEEFEIMKQHTTKGAALLSGSHREVLNLAEEIAISHHERWDGPVTLTDSRAMISPWAEE